MRRSIPINSRHALTPLHTVFAPVPGLFLHPTSIALTRPLPLPLSSVRPFATPKPSTKPTYPNLKYGSLFLRGVAAQAMLQVGWNHYENYLKENPPTTRTTLKK